MTCNDELHSIDLLNDSAFLNKTKVAGLFGVRVHTMYSKGGDPREHFDYTIGYKGARAVVDFIIPTIHVFEAGDVLDVMPRIGRDHPIVAVLMGAHSPEYLFDAGGVYQSPDRGDEPWTRMFFNDASLERVKEFEWRFTIFNSVTAVYKLWKPNFADFRTNKSKVWIMRIE